MQQIRVHTLWYFFSKNKPLFFSLLFLVVYSTIVAFAAPPTTPYTPQDNITDPGCAPGSTNCFVSVFPDQAGHVGEFLTTDGTLVSWTAVAAGGTGIGDTITSSTSGSVLFVDSSNNLAQDNAAFYWDQVNDRLGIGTNTPATKLSVAGSTEYTALETGALTRMYSSGSGIAGYFGSEGSAGFMIQSAIPGSQEYFLSLNPYGGDIGIGLGVNSPNAALEIGPVFSGSGTRRSLQVSESYATNSLTATYTGIYLNPTINQTGVGAGTIIGLDYNPVLTSIQGAHYAALFRSGNVGIGDATPISLLTVGNGDLFQVNSSGALVAATGITSSGTINFSGLTASKVVFTDGSKNLSSTGTVGVDQGGTGLTSPGTANQILGVNTAGTALEYKTFNFGSSGVDANITYGLNSATFNLPTASSSNRGLLSSTDWSVFNNKVGTTRSINTTSPLTGGGDLSVDRTIGLAGLTGLGGANQILGMNNAGTSYEYKTISVDTVAVSNDVGVTLSGANAIVINLPNSSATVRGVLSNSDWTTFNDKENILTFSTGLTRNINTVTSNLSTGISGGQSVIGGIGAGDNLTLSTTSNGTKGKILFGTSAYDEVNNRLGIGTSTPSYGLHINGGTITGNDRMAYMEGTLSPSTGNSIYGLFLNMNTSGTSTSSFIAGIRVVLNGGYSGSGITSGLSFYNNANATGTDFKFSTNNGTPGGNTGFTGFAFGTTAGLNIGGYGEGGNGNKNVGLYGKSNVNKNSAVNIGLLGVGRNTAVTSPTQIGGWFSLANTEPTWVSAALVADNGDQTSPIVLFKDNGTTIFNVIDGGNVGIGPLGGNPAQRLHVLGDGSDTTVVRIQTSGGNTCDFSTVTGTFSCASDLRLKNTITSIAGLSALEKISALNPVTYHYNWQTDADPLVAGFIAQEYETIFPELTSTNTDGYKMINQAITPYMVKAIQELNIRVTALDEITGGNPDFAGRIYKFFDRLFNRNEICVDDETCLTRDDVKTLINVARNQNTPQISQPTPSVVVTPEEEETKVENPPVTLEEEISPESPESTPEPVEIISTESQTSEE